MELASYLILVAFLILGAILVIQYLGLKYAECETVGRPAIVSIHYYSGKIALFIPWLFFIAKALFPNLGYIEPPGYLVWTSIVMLYIGTTLMIFGLVELGLSLKIGLPTEKIVLKTRGIYKISRNPIYTGSIIIAIASCLFYPDLINVTLTTYATIIHHLIILEEEKYLQNTFGLKYEEYRKSVRRYF
jgi:protein-S-isoprenylcysteine O-methyltransferase Ste14